MKKWIAALLAAMMLTVAGAQALESEIPAVGDCISGFTVDAVEPVPGTEDTAVIMTHDRTGARAVWFAGEDNNRSFQIGFRTQPWNDEGLPHIFEHSTLSGSEKYPDPSLFFSMMNQTYATLLNAFTFSSLTLFPAASLSEKQLAVYQDVVLSGVFHPLIMQDERAMMREAYRYELDDPDGEITLQGTVYSEMRGAYNAEEAADSQIVKQLFPGSFYGYISGGHPDHIADMTWEELKSFHDAYYHPSNSMTVLTGDIVLSDFLAKLDEEFAPFEKAEIDTSDANMTMPEGYTEASIEYPATADEDAQKTAYYAFRLDDATIEEQFVLSIAASMMNLEDSLFQQKQRELLPDATVNAAVSVANTAVPRAVFSAQNLETDEQVAVFKQIVEDVIADELEKGVNLDLLAAAIASQRYANAAQAEESGAGVSRAESTEVLWSMTGDPEAMLKLLGYQENLADYGDGVFVNDTFAKFFTSPKASTMVTVTTVPGLQEEKAAALAQKLADMKAAMSSEEIDALVQRTADFKAWTEENEKNSLIDQVKAVSASELPEEMLTAQAVTEQDGNIRWITCEVPEAQTVNISLIFDASGVPVESLRPLSAALDQMGSVPTEKYTVSELSAQQMTCADGLDIGVKCHETGDTWKPGLEVSWTTLSEMIGDSVDLMDQLLFHSVYSYEDVLANASASVYQTIYMAASSGMSPAVTAISGTFYPYGGYEDYSGGEGYLDYLKTFADMDEEAFAALVQDMQTALGYVLRGADMTVTIAGTQEDIAAAKQIISEYAAKLPQESAGNCIADYEALPQPSGSVAIEVPGTMQYCMEGADFEDLGMEWNGGMNVMAGIVTDKILVPVLRFRNSAYGASLSMNDQQLLMYSYRDPKLAETYEVFDNLGDSLRALELTQDDVDGYIVNRFTAYAMPMGPMRRASIAISAVLDDRDYFGIYQSNMHEMKQATPESIRSYAVLFDNLREKNVRACSGSVSAIEANKDMFETVDDYYIKN